jgi:hypothetical protein
MSPSVYLRSVLAVPTLPNTGPQQQALFLTLTTRHVHDVEMAHDALSEQRRVSCGASRVLRCVVF